MACEGLDVNIDWQFNANAAEGDVRSESPLAGLSLLAAIGRFDTSTMEMTPFAPIHENMVVGSICYGQRHNAGVVTHYQQCRAALPSIFAFCRAIVACSGGRTADFAAAQHHLSWQEGANPESIRNAAFCFTSAENFGSRRVKDFYEACAMYHLMLGQRHNASAMQLYRACFRENPPALFYRVGLNRFMAVQETLGDQLEVNAWIEKKASEYLRPDQIRFEAESEGGSDFNESSR
jgi:hypothetical protein